MRVQFYKAEDKEKDRPIAVFWDAPVPSTGTKVGICDKEGKWYTGRVADVHWTYDFESSVGAVADVILLVEGG